LNKDARIISKYSSGRLPQTSSTLQQQVELATEKALQRAKQHAQQGAGHGQRQRKQHRYAKAIDQPRQHIAPTVIGAQHIVVGRRRRIGIVGKVIHRVVAVGIGRINGEIARPGKLVLDEGVQIIGCGIEIATKGGFLIIEQHREIQLVVITHHQRPVVGQQLGPQRQDKQQQETATG
jgi:hypothetical protein